MKFKIIFFIGVFFIRVMLNPVVIFGPSIVEASEVGFINVGPEHYHGLSVSYPIALDFRNFFISFPFPKSVTDFFGYYIVFNDDNIVKKCGIESSSGFVKFGKSDSFKTSCSSQIMTNQESNSSRSEAKGGMGDNAHEKFIHDMSNLTVWFLVGLIIAMILNTTSV